MRATSSDFAEYQQMSGSDVLMHMSQDGGANKLMQIILQRMVSKLSEARAAYFRKPVASMPMGASTKDATRLATLHPELRELVFEKNEAISDAQFQGCRHLAVRRCMLQLLAADSSIVEKPYTHQILLDGIHPYEHSFVYHTQVPMVDISLDQCDEGSRHFLVADIVRSKRSIQQILRYSREAASSETIIVTPYDARMWSYVGGQQLDGAYSFEWMERGRSVIPALVKPAKLPSGFFKSSRYSNWSLYIQPFGSSEAIRFTRLEFLTLFAGQGIGSRFVETRVIRNGFAEVSFIGFAEVGLSTDVEVVVQRESIRSVPMGHVEVRSLTSNFARETLIPGRHLDLSTVVPVYVRQSYYEKAMQQFYTLKAGRQVIPAMIRTLHANSAHMVYNGAIVTVESMIGVEHMCMVLEDVVASNIRAKTKLSTVGAQVRVPIQFKPLDYAASLASWAAMRAIRGTDLIQGARDVVSYLNDTSAGRVIADSDELALDILPELKYGPPGSDLDHDKQEYSEVISQYAEDVFGGVDVAYTVERDEFPIDREVVFQLKLDLSRYSAQQVRVEEVQAIYDGIFPGNSMIDPTMRQLQAESGDVKFIVDVQYFKVSIPLMFSTLEGYTVIPSRLRTSIAADLMGSFRSLMSSLMKRNFNRPRPEAPGSRTKYVEITVDRCINRFGHKYSGVLLAMFAQNPISVSKSVVEAWAAKHPISDVVAAATMLIQEELDPTAYRLMPKDIPKPTLSLESQGTIHAGQTIVYHSKDVISLTVGVFAQICSRLLTLFGTNIRFAFGADEHMSGVWADQFLDMPDVHIEEIDVPKFDKTQDWTCFELILRVMEMMGAEPDLVTFWRRASGQSTVFSAAFHLVFRTMFGNRSGSAATLATNCIVLLFAYLDSFGDLGILGMLIKGDDSVMVTKRPIQIQHEQYLYEHWGFTMKRVGRKGVVTFCSSVFVKDSGGHYQLIRDIVRVIEKFGRALPVNRPASYFLDYYVSVIDTAKSYDDPVVVENLQRAITLIYGQPIDVRTLVAFVQYISSSTETFLTVLYGLSPSQIEGIRNIEEAVETMSRVRSTRFVKGKDLVDKHSVLKLTLLEKMKISSDWIFDAC